MPIYTIEKEDPNKPPQKQDYWLVDGSRDWAFIKGKLARNIGVPHDTPIRLCVGNERIFGAKHIMKKQRYVNVCKMLEKHLSKDVIAEMKKNNTYAQEYLWMKLGHGGTVLSDEENNKNKCIFTIRTSPSSLLILKKRKCQKDGTTFLSVVSLYEWSKSLGGDNLGTYRSNWRFTSNPQ